MPLDPKLFHSPATRGQVAITSLKARMIAVQTASALRKVQTSTGIDMSSEIAEIDKAWNELSAQFDELVGWVAE